MKLRPKWDSSGSRPMYEGNMGKLMKKMKAFGASHVKAHIFFKLHIYNVDNALVVNTSIVYNSTKLA